MRLRHALPAIAAVALVWLAPSATAGEQIRLVEAGRAVFPKRSFVLTLPAKRSLGERDVQVLENGERVADLSVTPAGSTSEDSGVVLVIDASKSMRGHAIRDAMAAARVFAERRPPNQHMGVVAFNRRASVLLPLTTDDRAINEALANSPVLANGTHLYDGVDTAVALLDETDVSLGTVIVLSDGADTGSRASAATVAADARDARVRVFTVGIQSAQFTAAPLRTLGAQTSGAYAEATSTAELARIYSELGTRLANEYVLTYRSKVRPNRSVLVSVRVTGVRGLAVSGYKTPRAREAAAGPYHRSALDRVLQSPLTMLLVALTIAALLAFTVFSLFVPRRRTLRARMAEFVSLRTPRTSADEAAQGRVGSRVLVGAERSLEATRWWARFKETLELAEIRMSASRIALWTLAATLLAMWLLAVIGGSPVFALVGLAVPLVVRSVIYRKLERRRKLFAEQLPDNLQVLASALRAGHSLVGALSVVIDDADDPSRTEFRRVVADEQLGVPLEDAIRSVVRRMDNEDLEQVALVAALQRRTGGNMAEVLERVTETVRERFELRRMIQTLTAQGRMSRWIVTALPIVLLLAISALNPGYTNPLLTTTAGRLLLLFAGLMLVAGSLVIKKIVNIKV
jgi:tight adherence protein B